MADPTPQEAAYIRAAEIANALLGDGIPLFGFGQQEGGRKVAIAFQLTDERAKYVASLPLAEATPERFRRLYEAVR